MPATYDSIPPERELLYMQHAAEEAAQAEERVIMKLGHEAVARAQHITNAIDAQAAYIGDEVEAQVHRSSVADEAERYLSIESIKKAYRGQGDRTTLKNMQLAADYERSKTIGKGGAKSKNENSGETGKEAVQPPEETTE